MNTCIPKPPVRGKTTVYISGPIAGKEDGNKYAFALAEEEWTEAGWIAINPRDFTSNEGKTWEDCLRHDLQQMLYCAAVAVLPDWWHSRGASLEVAVAKALNMPVYGAASGALITGTPHPFQLPPIATTETYKIMSSGDKLIAELPLTETITQEAGRIVNGARQGDYGHPLDNFSLTGKLWSAILNTEVTAEQVGLMMIALKIAREVHKPTRDNRVDIAGYAETLDLIADERTRRTS